MKLMIRVVQVISIFLIPMATFGGGIVGVIPILSVLYYSRHAMNALKAGKPMEKLDYIGSLLSSVMAGLVIAVANYFLAPLENLDTTGEAELSTIIGGSVFALIYAVLMLTTFVLLQNKLKLL